MDKYQETYNTWNNIAALYQEKFMDLNLYNDTYDVICKSITNPHAKLLDIGCGPGNITKYLLSQRPDFDILGIDMAPNMIALAKANIPQAHFEVMDSRDIGKLETSYDGIVCGFCLPYLLPAETDELIANAYHLLNENGLLYLSFVEGDPNQSDFKTGSGGRVYFQYHRLDDLIRQLAAMKYREIETFKVKYPTSGDEFDIHTIVVAKKRGF